VTATVTKRPEKLIWNYDSRFYRFNFRGLNTFIKPNCQRTATGSPNGGVAVLNEAGYLPPSWIAAAGF
jgi:hypothetical protein